VASTIIKKEKNTGYAKRFFPNGKLKSSCTYGNKPQACSSYYSSGQLKEKGTCIGVQKIGLWEIYHPNGNLSKTGFYTANNSAASFKQGLWKSYHSNGQLESTGEYLQGIRHGLWKKYFSDGSLSDNRTY
jgi:antitoxin component YwqK of YwqJK toxin-antitoxin module